MQRRWPERVLYALFGFLCGTLGVGAWGSVFQREISLGEILSAVVTVILALVVSVGIDRMKSSNAARSACVLARVDEVRQAFRNAHALSSKLEGSVWSRTKQDEVTEKLREASICLTDAEELSLELYGINHFVEVRQNYKEYKLLVTNNGKSNPYTGEKVIDAAAAYEAIRKGLGAVVRIVST